MNQSSHVGPPFVSESLKIGVLGATLTLTPLRAPGAITVQIVGTEKVTALSTANDLPMGHPPHLHRSLRASLGRERFRIP